MTPAPTLQDLITSVRDDASSDDPLELLTTAVNIATDLDTVKDELLGYFVDRCRGGGKSWTEISGALGVTRQAAHRRFNVSDPPLDRFTERTRRVIELAPETARALNHGYVGTEHLLLAILGEGEGVGARVLRERGLTEAAVEAAVVMVAPRSATTPTGPIPYNPRAATALTGAVTSAIELGHNYVGTEHLLLALLRDPDALAAKILYANQIGIDDVRERVIEILGALVASSAPHSPVDHAQLVASGVIVDGFSRFSDAARDVIVRAQEEARSLQHAYLGTEHLLLGCFGTGASIAERVLDMLDVTKALVRAEIVRITGAGPGPVEGNIPFTARARARLEQTLVEAGDLHDAHVEPEHILLALVAGDDPGIAAHILAERGGTKERISDLVLEVLQTPAPTPTPARAKRAASKPTAAKRTTPRKKP